MSIATEIAKQLLQIKAIKLSPQNPFTWASGMQSPIYCDNRITLSYPKVRHTLKEGFVAASQSFSDFDVVVGVATGGIAHGVLLAEALDKPFCYVRSKAKGHGRQNLVEGELKQGAKVLVVEDLISTGGSCLKAVQAIRDHGAEVAGVLAIFTYGFPIAEEAFKNANCILKTISNYNILLEEAVKSNYIEATDLASLQEWKKNPQAWSSSLKTN